MSVFGIISFAFGGGNRSITDEQIERQKRKAMEREDELMKQHLRRIEEQKKARYYQSIQRNQQAIQDSIYSQAQARLNGQNSMIGNMASTAALMAMA